MAWAPVGGVPPPAAAATAVPREWHRVAGPVRENLASPLDLTDEELRRRVESDLPSLGSLSIGAPSGAILLNAVNLPEGPYWLIAPSADTWGTSETIAGIQAAIEKVQELFPETQPLFIGDISDADGGRLKRHQTHQGGRDADFGFYYRDGKAKWFEPGSAANLDLPRNWTLVRALITCTDVETILLDTRIQKALYTYALSISEDKAWLDRVFQFSKGSKDAIIRHVPLHRTHYHVRFYNPVAQELGRRAFPFLVEAKIVQPPVFTVRHIVQPGQTLGHLATRYGVSVRAIMQANGLSTTQLRAGRAYRIPVKAAAPPIQAVVVPLRMLPPDTPAELGSATWPTMLSLYPERLGALLEPPRLLTLALPRF
jgi:LysM repeat protein/murein endopeptidase